MDVYSERVGQHDRKQDDGLRSIRQWKLLLLNEQTQENESSSVLTYNKKKVERQTQRETSSK